MASRVANIVSKVARGGAIRSMVTIRATVMPRMAPKVSTKVIGARAFGSAEVSGNRASDFRGED